MPHGGITPIVTPNPIAAGIPTSGDPILIDVSTSITSMGFIRQRLRCRREAARPLGASTPRATPPTIPTSLFAEPKGALLPLGGLDAGYKGFGLALMIEALTAGLAGSGRADPPEGWGATVFVQVIDPGGVRRRRRRSAGRWTGWSRRATRRRPRPGVDRVRVPGEAGMRRLREQRELGVALYPTILPALLPWARSSAWRHRPWSADRTCAPGAAAPGCSGHGLVRRRIDAHHGSRPTRTGSCASRAHPPAASAMTAKTTAFVTDKRFVRRARELKTIRVMVEMHCRDHHGSPDPLCPRCAELMDYAARRLERCVFGDAKPTCTNCTVHCYTADKREEVRVVMRYAGPRMLLRHPWLGITHLLDGRRAAPLLPEKPAPKAPGPAAADRAPGTSDTGER